MADQLITSKKQKGKLFFLTLIIVSGICVFSLLFLEFEGDRVTVYTIEKFVLNPGLFEKEILDEVNPEEKKQVVSDLHQFFSSAKSRFESKEKVAMVSDKMREVMEDKKITKEEIQALENLLKN